MTSSIYGADPYPLRASHLALLRDLVGIQGEHRVARQVGTSARALQAYCEGQPPSASERAKIIGCLVRSGLVRSTPRDPDPHAPDGSEQWTPEMKREARAARVAEKERRR